MTRAFLERFPEAKFGGFSYTDGTVAFYAHLAAMIRPDMTVADIGCGRGTQADDPVQFRRELRILRGKASKVVGLDVDPVAKENPFIDEFRMIEGDRWEAADAEFDVCVADFVLEHIERPDAFFAELARVTKPGGVVALRTTNVRSYVGLASRLIPNRHHAKVATRVQERRKAEDVFPTYYRCNTPGKLRRALRKAGFEPAVRGYEAEPMYFAFSPFLYRMAALHTKLMPQAFHVGLFAYGRRQ